MCMRPWIRRYPFSLDFCPRRATRVWSLQKYVWNVLLMILKCCLMISKCCVYDFERSFDEFEMEFNVLSSCLNNLRESGPTKGGGTLKRPAALCRFCRSQNSSNCCLRSRIFPFNPFWLAGANQKITFWGPWTYFKIICDFDSDLTIFIFLSFIP